MIKNTTEINYTSSASGKHDALLVKQRREIDRLNDALNELKESAGNKTANEKEVDDLKNRIKARMTKLKILLEIYRK